jgi:hypothetical protein
MSSDSPVDTKQDLWYVYCKWCRKNHTVALGEKECGPHCWVEEGTGLTRDEILRMRRSV